MEHRPMPFSHTTARTLAGLMGTPILLMTAHLLEITLVEALLITFHKQDCK